MVHRVDILFLLVGSNKFAPISWYSKKLKRIVRRTLAAETLATQDVAENCFLIRNTLCELYEISMDAVYYLWFVLQIANLYDSVHSTKTGKRLKIDFGSIREMLSKKNIGGNLERK